MEGCADMGYVFPALTNILFSLLKPRTNDLDDVLHYPILIVIALLLLFIFILLALFTSIRLSFNDMRIRCRPGHFSAPVAVLLLASVILPPSLFWCVYLISIVTSPFHGMLFNLLKRSLRWLLHSLRSIPPLTISFTRHPQQQPSPSPAPAPAPAPVQPLLVEIVQDASPDVNGTTAAQPTDHTPTNVPINIGA